MVWRTRVSGPNVSPHILGTKWAVGELRSPRSPFFLRTVKLKTDSWSVWKGRYGHRIPVSALPRETSQTVPQRLAQDSGYKKEQSSAGHDAEFLLTNLEPKNAGTYFCAYKITGSHEWSEKSEHLQLVVTDGHDGPGASSIKTGSSHEESNKRTSHSKFPQQEASDLSGPERVSLSTEDPQEGTYADLNTKAPSEAASVPAEEPPGSCECATLTA
ncbi:V-set and transmembrane domain-containing protein 1 isoform X4 [Rhinolophus sinicus]|uniref:V-set and transmembrane domain-containing protein 1 isoform X4 n=1 Tax=Rhinolophus sinicus TaxID=89399 RepID=UPI003D794A1D